MSTEENSRAIFSDYLAITEECKTCKHERGKTCPAWCYEFTREQFREVHERAQAAEMSGKPYEKIYC